MKQIQAKLDPTCCHSQFLLVPHQESRGESTTRSFTVIVMRTPHAGMAWFSVNTCNFQTNITNENVILGFNVVVSSPCSSHLRARNGVSEGLAWAANYQLNGRNPSGDQCELSQSSWHLIQATFTGMKFPEISAIFPLVSAISTQISAIVLGTLGGLLQVIRIPWVL